MNRRQALVRRHESRLSKRSPRPGADLGPGAVQPVRRKPVPASGAGGSSGAARLPELPAETAQLLAAGRLSQRCPGCGITEAAGFYCTKCGLETGPADWYRQERGRPKSATYPNLTLAVRQEILERDVWTCGICGEAIDREIPAGEPDSATVDHIMSVHNGGDWYDPANLQAAHLRCNVAKDGGRPPGIGENGIKRGPGRPRASVATPPDSGVQIAGGGYCPTCEREAQEQTEAIEGGNR